MYMRRCVTSREVGELCIYLQCMSDGIIYSTIAVPEPGEAFDGYSFAPVKFAMYIVDA